MNSCLSESSFIVLFCNKDATEGKNALEIFFCEEWLLFCLITTESYKSCISNTSYVCYLIISGFSWLHVQFLLQIVFSYNLRDLSKPAVKLSFVLMDVGKSTTLSSFDFRIGVTPPVLTLSHEKKRVSFFRAIIPTAVKLFIQNFLLQ